jgi:hypothetical protein
VKTSRRYEHPAFAPHTGAPKYGSLEGNPVRWLGWEAWELGRDGTWHEINAADAATKARVMTEQEYHGHFGPLPPLPVTAFPSG